MVRETLPQVVELDGDNFDEITTLDLPALVAFTDAEDVETIGVFKVVSEVYKQKLVCGITSNLSLSGVTETATPFFVAFNALDESRPFLQGPIDSKMVLEFSKKNNRTCYWETRPN
jgi:hypothetical protein